MSFLAPLYALGLLAISLPVLFHFIRRTPRGDYDISTLMFLSASPPRLTRRSRLDHFLLLILRGLVLSLLALAFARPYLQQAVLADAAESDQQRVAVLLDTSASMRRGDLWQQATESALRAVAECRPYDEVAVFLCDESLRPLAGLEEMAQVEPAKRRTIIASRLRSVNPSWNATHLGQGLMDAVQFVYERPANSTTNTAAVAPRIVLVSDLQEGSRLEALAEYQWPADLRVELRPVEVERPTNAGLHRLDSQSMDEPIAASSVRVRVSNDAASTGQQFQSAWMDHEGRASGSLVDAFVPAGESRVLRISRPAKLSVGARLNLRGDDHDFDNTLYFADGAPTRQTIGYLGTDAPDDPAGLHFYAARLVAGMGPNVQFAPQESDGSLTIDSPDRLPLVIVTNSPNETQTKDLKKYVEKGGTLLFVVTAAAQGSELAALLDVPPFALEEAIVDDYVMLGRIEFDHPLFAPMAGPQFNDFTQIHFWKYRRLDAAALGNVTVLAQFENGDPAVIERRVGRGTLYVLTSGWHPSDSQLARSWKLVPLLATMARGRNAADRGRLHIRINEPVPRRDLSNSDEPLTITKPDGSEVTLAADAILFTAADQPGVYSVASADGPRQFAVNLDPMESKTAPLEREAIEQLGIPLVNRLAVANNREQRRRLHDAQLESRQKIWQWLVAAALGLVVAETWLAGHLSRRSFEEVSHA